MTAAIDIRANVYCSLGEVISGSFSDTYAQSAGLIKTRGQVVLNGIYRPAMGAPVEFAWTRSGIASRLPRRLRVLSLFADPFTKTTTIQIGCLLTYNENRKPPVTVKATSAGSFPGIPSYARLQANFGISASYVLTQCLTALSITATSNPLQNHYNGNEFDLTSGYITVMDGLLQSEGYLGYLNSSEQLVIRDMAPAVTEQGPLITNANIISINPIGVGEVPGDGVVVKYNSLRLVPGTSVVAPAPVDDVMVMPPSPEILKRNWELDTVIAAPKQISATYKDADDEEVTLEGTYVQGATQVFRVFDAWDRLREALTYSNISAMDANSLWVTDYYKAYNGVPPIDFLNSVYKQTYESPTYSYGAPEGADTTDLRVTVYSGGINGATEALSQRYAEQANAGTDGDTPDENYSVLLQQTTIEYISEIELASALQLQTFIYENTDGSYSGPPYYGSEATIIKSQTVVSYYQDPESGVSKTITEFYQAYAYTVSGAAKLAWNVQNRDYEENGGQFLSFVEEMFDMGKELIYMGAETSIRSEREFGLQRRPSQADRNLSVTIKSESTSADTRGRPTLEQSVETAWLTGSGTESTNIIEFTLPYSTNDKVVWDNTTLSTSVYRSIAEAVALRYGRIQNALLLGNRNGASLQIPVELMPAAPLDPLYVQVDGLMGQYRTNGTTYTFDANGIVATTDALFVGGVAA